MIASLFMYRYPELDDAHNRFWALIRMHLGRRGIDSPEKLRQEAGEFSDWQHPSLVFSQTCALPYRTWLHGSVELVGTPDYGLTDCAPGYYRSAFVVRTGDSRSQLRQYEHSQFAYNSKNSQSGYAAPHWHTQKNGFRFTRQTELGTHLRAGHAVVDGRADIAALDAISWILMQRYTDLGVQLRVIEWTDPTPGLPYITARGVNASLVFDAVTDAVSDLSVEDRDDLHIKGIVRIPEQDYLAVKSPDPG